MTENLNSKKVVIKRAPSFLSRTQGKEADEFYQSAVKEIGSYFESSSSYRIASGLNVDEEKLLLEQQLGIDPKDRDFIKDRNKFYQNIFTKVPKDGVELEIGLLKSNSKPVSEDNMPINIIDYIKYRHHIKHPWVAASEQDAAGNQLKRFYIEDEVSTAKAAVLQSDLKDEALSKYFEIKDDPKKVDMYLTLLGKDPREIEGQNKEHTEQLRRQALRNEVDTNPELIKKYGLDKNFEYLYNIKSMVNTGVLKVVAGTYIVADSGERLGSEEEVIEFLKNDVVNNEMIMILKQKMSEGLKSGRKVRRNAR